jgi:hypothetical protein
LLKADAGLLQYASISERHSMFVMALAAAPTLSGIYVLLLIKN